MKPLFQENDFSEMMYEYLVNEIWLLYIYISLIYVRQELKEQAFELAGLLNVDVMARVLNENDAL
jgi:hypothetical protein